MEKNQMNSLIESLRNVQQLRQERVDKDKVRLRDIRVVNEGRQFYATVTVTQNFIVIVPNDSDILATYLESMHLRGFNDGTKSIELILMCNRSRYTLHFRTEEQTKRVLNRLKMFVGAETTSDSNQINNLIESLRNVQQLRQERVDKDKMRLRDIRVVNEGRQFYATVTVTQNFILIVPNDWDISATYLESMHLRGFNDGTKSIELILMCNRSRYTLHFRTEAQTRRVLNRIKMFAGAETTSDPNQINNLIESLRNVQQLRQERVDKDKMRLRDIRVVNEGRQFYATVTVTQNFIVIVPNDSDILATYLESMHLRGFNDGTKSIELILMCNRSRYTLHFRTEEQTKRVLNGLKMFAGAETTSDSNQINNLIESLRNVQQLRQESVDKDKMRLRDIRVVNEGRQFYATVTVTQNFILIVPNDSDILATYLENRHSRRFNDGTKSIELILMYNKPRYTLHFRTEEQTKRVLNGLKMFAGAETTSDSSESR